MPCNTCSNQSALPVHPTHPPLVRADFAVFPLFGAFTRVFPGCKPLITQIDHNYKFWQTLQQQQQAMAMAGAGSQGHQHEGPRSRLTGTKNVVVSLEANSEVVPAGTGQQGLSPAVSHTLNAMAQSSQGGGAAQALPTAASLKYDGDISIKGGSRFKNGV